MNEKDIKKSNTYNSDITKEDQTALGDKAGHLKTNLSGDEILKHRKEAIDFTGKDIDIPRRQLLDEPSRITLKHEENHL